MCGNGGQNFYPYFGAGGKSGRIFLALVAVISETSAELSEFVRDSLLLAI